MKRSFSAVRLFTSIVLIAFISVLCSTMFSGSLDYAPAIAGSLLAAGAVKGLVENLCHISLSWHVPGALLDGFVISDTTYAGEAASTFIVKAITSNETVDGGHVYVKDGIKKKFTIPRWDADYEDFIQDRAATPTSKGTMTVTGQSLTPQDYMIYTEFNPRDYEAHWFATMLNETLIDRTLPLTVESVVVQEVLKRHNKYLNKALWNSSTALTNIYKYYDGFIKKALDSAETIDVGSPTTITVNNVQAELLRGYNLIPAELRYDVDMKFFMSYATYDLYMQSQIAQTYKGVDTTSEGIPKFKGRDTVKIADLPDNFYLIAKGNATPGSNMWVGMNSTDDAKLELSRLQNNSELWFIKMLMKVDVNFGWNSETVMYNAN
jgi:hypothetical protein